MGLDCPRVKPRGIAAAAGESGLGAPSGDAGLGRFNLHSLEIGMLRKARGRPLRWLGSTHHDRYAFQKPRPCMTVCLGSERNR